MEAQATFLEERTHQAERRLAAVGSPRPAGQGMPVDWRVRLALLGAALATGGLLWLCYFPVSCGWLAWVALVPLLALVRARETPRFLFLCALLAGLVFYAPALWWMHAADGLRDGFLSVGPMTGAGYFVTLYCALYIPLTLALLRRFDRHLPLPLLLTLPVVWTGLEFLRSFLGTGFPWYFLGHSQHDYLAVIQVADLGGAYLVTFLVAAVNGTLFEWLYVSPPVRRLLGQREAGTVFPWRRLTVLTACVAGLVLGALAYGAWRLEQHAFKEGPRLALLQGSLDQRIRNQAAAEGANGRPAWVTIIRHYGELCQEAARQNPRPDLIVWPETSFPADWYDLPAHFPLDQVPAEWEKLQDDARGFARQLAAGDCRTNVLLGLNTRVLADGQGHFERYNSALLVTAGGATGGRYDKVHRLPFGEYLPLPRWLPLRDIFSPYDFDYSIHKGDKLTRFPLGAHHFGVLICYEDSDPRLARQYGSDGKDGPAADFLVNISNDGWFNGTAEHEEHLAICRFRAVESRRSIARAVNMGISAVIDGNGRVLKPEALVSYDPKVPLWNVPSDAGQTPDLPLSRWGDFKKVQGVLLASIPLDDRTSLYSLWGDWLPWACWLVVGLGLVTVWRRGAQYRSQSSPQALGKCS